MMIRNDPRFPLETYTLFSEWFMFKGTVFSLIWMKNRASFTQQLLFSKTDCFREKLTVLTAEQLLHNSFASATE